MAQTMHDVLHSWLEAGTRHTTPDVNIETIADVVPQFDDTDKLAVSIYGGLSVAGDTNLSVLNPAQDAVSPDYPLQVSNFNVLFNDSDGGWDRARNNGVQVLLASSARTATVQSSDNTNYNGKRLQLYINVSDLSGTPSVTPYIEVKDSISETYFRIWTADAAITALGSYVYYFADGASGGNFTETQPFGIPTRTGRVGMTHADTDSITYSVEATVLL